MKFWVFDPKKRDALGPFGASELSQLPNFGPATLVAPDGAKDTADWRPARSVEALRPLFGKPPPLPQASSQPEAPLTAAPAGGGDAGSMALVAFVLTWGNVAWQTWLIIVTNQAPHRDLKRTLGLYGLIMFGPALATLFINSAARRRAARTGSLQETSVLTTIAVTVGWITFIVVGLWFALLYAGAQGGS